MTGGHVGAVSDIKDIVHAPDLSLVSANAFLKYKLYEFQLHNLKNPCIRR